MAQHIPSPGASDEKKVSDHWFWKSNFGRYQEYPDDISYNISQAPLNKTLQFTIKSGNSETVYELIKTNQNCAWQRNKITNRVRPVICNYNEDTDDKQILNQKNARNPFALATQGQSSETLKQKFRRFCQILPGMTLFSDTQTIVSCSS